MNRSLFAKVDHKLGCRNVRENRLNTHLSFYETTVYGSEKAISKPSKAHPLAYCRAYCASTFSTWIISMKNHLFWPCQVNHRWDLKSNKLIAQEFSNNISVWPTNDVINIPAAIGRKKWFFIPAVQKPLSIWILYGQLSGIHRI